MCVYACSMFLQCQQATAEAQERSSKRSRMLPSGPGRKKWAPPFDSKGLLKEEPSRIFSFQAFCDGLGILYFFYFIQIIELVNVEVDWSDLQKTKHHIMMRIDSTDDIAVDRHSFKILHQNRRTILTPSEGLGW